MKTYNTTGWFNNPSDMSDVSVTAVPSNAPMVYATEAPSDYIYNPNGFANAPVVALMNKYYDLRDDVRKYFNDPYKAPQQAIKAVNTASLGERTNAVLGTVGTLMQAYNSYKTNKLADKQLNHAKEVYHNNLANQRKMTNSKLEDRQRRRVEEAKANGRSTTSVSDYMAKYGV